MKQRDHTAYGDGNTGGYIAEDTLLSGYRIHLVEAYDEHNNHGNEYHKPKYNRKIDADLRQKRQDGKACNHDNVDQDKDCDHALFSTGLLLSLGLDLTVGFCQLVRGILVQVTPVLREGVLLGNGAKLNGVENCCN